MSGLALALVMCGAALHVAWSIAAKFGSRGRDPVGFIWASSLITSMLLAPIALWTASATQVSWSSVLFGASIAATLQLSYFLLVQTGYAVGDVSVLYPISRGIGPALTMVGAVLIFGERPNVLALVGLLRVWLSSRPHSWEAVLKG